MNENITLRFDDGSTLKVSRYRLDREFVQNYINRIAAKKALVSVKVSHLVSAKDETTNETLLFSHLHHRDSNTIIMSNSDLTRNCLANVTYDVIARSAISIKEGGVLCGCGGSSSSSSHHESHYDGTVLYIIQGLPMTSQNGKFEVTENDVRRWIVSGAIRKTESVDVLANKIKSLKQSIFHIQQEITTLSPSTTHFGGKGKVTAGSSSSSMQSVKDKNNKRTKFLSDEMKRSKSLLQTATQSLETIYRQHMKDCSLSVEKRSSNDKTCDWAIQVTAGEKESMYTRLIEKNKNWSMIPMYATSNKNDTLLTPVDDQPDHFVDIGGISMSKLPHGRGIFESYEQFPLRKSRHRLYHGQFHEGQFSMGTLYSESGVYMGKFDEGKPTEGTMEYVDGIKISGNFDDDDMSLQTRTNPYRRGLPDGGEMLCKFHDKAIYKGDMSQGRITGRGYYKYAGTDIELSGHFLDGVLLVDGGDEGQGFCNLHLSFFGGERLWGPTTTTMQHKA
jgi:hypothetical protein